MINYYVLEVKGKNPKRFLNKLFKEKIDIFDIEYQRNTVIFKTSYENYKKVLKIKGIYEVRIIRTIGINKLKYIIKKYRLFLCFSFLSIATVILLSGFLFKINIKTEKTSLRNLIKEELNNYNLTIFSPKKSHSQLIKISNQIKKDHKDKIEWIYISNEGVTLEVKLIERLSNKKDDNNNLTDIVAQRSGFIKDIYSSSGEIIKFKGDYVKKGDVIIRGNIIRNNEVVSRVKAKGKVFAEVWYNVKVSSPLTYEKQKKKEKGTFKVIVNIFNKDITILKINKKISKEKEKSWIKSPIMELKTKSSFDIEKYKTKLAKEKLVKILEQEAKKEIEKELNNEEYIIQQKTLKKNKKNDKMYIEVFFKVYKNIAQEKTIQEIEELELNKEE